MWSRPHLHCLITQLSRWKSAGQSAHVLTTLLPRSNPSLSSDSLGLVVIGQTHVELAKRDTRCSPSGASVRQPYIITLVGLVRVSFKSRSSNPRSSFSNSRPSPPYSCKLVGREVDEERRDGLLGLEHVGH